MNRKIYHNYTYILHDIIQLILNYTVLIVLNMVPRVIVDSTIAFCLVHYAKLHSTTDGSMLSIKY